MKLTTSLSKVPSTWYEDPLSNKAQQFLKLIILIGVTKGSKHIAHHSIRRVWPHLCGLVVLILHRVLVKVLKVRPLTHHFKWVLFNVRKIRYFNIKKLWCFGTRASYCYRHRKPFVVRN